MKKTGFLLFVLIFILQSAVAQENMVSGIITSADDGTPLIGASVVIKGTTKGVVSDVDGKFSIMVSSGETIEIKFVGYISREYTITSAANLNVVLNPDTKALDEVIVVGYGTQKKSDITGSVVSVSSDKITQTPVAGVDQALQGRAAGVTILSNSGQPGSGVTIRVRGIGTVNNSDPLYVVDGVSLSNINFLSPNDIQSIEILKDASAAAIYGSRGANGVVLITTKRGASSEKMNVTVDIYKGVQNVWKTLDLMNSEQYAKVKGYDPADTRYTSFSDWVYRNPDFNLSTNPYVPNNIDYSQYETDWQDVIFRKNAQISNYYVSFDGGNESGNYAMSAGYFDQDGIIISSNYKRLTFRLNTSKQALKFLKVGENISFTNSKNRGVATNNENYSMINSAISLAPWDPPRYSDGRITPSSTTNLKNPLSMVENENPSNNWNRLVGDVYLELTPLKGLTFKSDIGVDISYGDFRNYKPKYFISSNDYMANSFLEHSYQKYSGWQWENTFTFNRKIAQKHDFTVLAGMTAQESSYDGLGGSKTHIPENPNQWYLDASTSNPTVGGGAWEWAMLSYLGRLNYSFSDKYLLTLNIRRDGSARFGKNFRWGTFPSLALGWKISEENFFQPFKGIFNSAKIRVGWGQVGNQEIGNYMYTTKVTGGTTFVSYVLGNPQVIASGVAPLTSANPDLHWETTEQTNAGLDLGMFKNKLTVYIDYFIKDTKDMLVAIPVPGIAGLRYDPIFNAGSVRNSGFEFSADLKNSSGKFNYSLGGNFAIIKNEVTSLGGGEDIYKAPFFGENITRTRIGDPIASFYGYKVLGIFQDTYDVEEHVNSKEQQVQPLASPGDFIYMNQNDDNKIDLNDKVNIGNPFPSLSYGFNGSFEFKGIDLQIFFQGVYGNKIFNANKRFLEGTGETNLSAEMVNAWHGKGTSNTLANPNGSPENLNVSSRYVEDGSYLRLKNLQLGYTLQGTWLRKINVSKWRIYASGTNLLTFTDYSGYDPEIGQTATLEMAVDRSVYPQARTITMGMTVNF